MVAPAFFSAADPSGFECKSCERVIDWYVRALLDDVEREAETGGRRVSAGVLRLVMAVLAECAEPDNFEASAMRCADSFCRADD